MTDNSIAAHAKAINSAAADTAFRMAAIPEDAYARAFNAVAPALQAQGEWLRLTTRQEVARAVLVALASELNELAELRALLRRDEATEDATTTRVVDLYERWVKAGPPPLGVLIARWWDARLIELHGAIHTPTAASCSPAAAETEPNNPRTTLDNPAASSWTPPPPGDRREQLPDAILALVPERDYLSTACDTAQQLEQAPAPIPTSSGVIPNVAWYVQMLHARCRRNQKFTGQLCGCGCHPHAVPDFTSPIAGRIEVRRPCPWCGDRQMIPRHQYAEHVARLHPDVHEGGPGIPMPDAEGDPSVTS